MVPNIIHFIFGMAPDFGGRPFMLFHYLAIKSAFEVNRPDKIYFVCAYLPDGEWFEKSKPYIEIVKITPPNEIFGNPLMHYAHQADIVRLERMMEWGGIYLDLDTICLKPLAPFLNSDRLIMGQAYRHWKYKPTTFLRKLLQKWNVYNPKIPRELVGLCNAVLIAPPGSEFIKKWYQSYSTFRAKGHDEYWDEHSVKIPNQLAHRFPEEISVLDEIFFFYPSFDDKGLSLLFEENRVFADSYLFHLWESVSYEKYLSKITQTSIASRLNTYSSIAFRYL